MHTATPFVMHHEKPRMAPAAIASLTTHAAVISVLILLKFMPAHSPAGAKLPDQLTRDLVWLRDPGTGGGGGGGGNKHLEPARRVQQPGRDPISVPARRPDTINRDATPIDVKLQQPEIPVQSLGASLVMLPGVIPALPGASPDSLGPGSRYGAGTGTDGGIGSGRGRGLGDGSEDGTGGGPRRPGNGVTEPTLIREVKPAYTSDAMRARLQGSVWVRAVVGVDGTVTDARVVRSLDPYLGLDAEALKAARQWRFRPGTFHGEPVPVQIVIELLFSVR